MIDAHNGSSSTAVPTISGDQRDPQQRLESVHRFEVGAGEHRVRRVGVEHHAGEVARLVDRRRLHVAERRRGGADEDDLALRPSSARHRPVDHVGSGDHLRRPRRGRARSSAASTPASSVGHEAVADLHTRSGRTMNWLGGMPSVRHHGRERERGTNGAVVRLGHDERHAPADAVARILVEVHLSVGELGRLADPGRDRDRSRAV